MTTRRSFWLSSGAILLLFLTAVVASEYSGSRQRRQIDDQESAIKPIERIEDLRTVNHTSAFNVVGIQKISDELFEITYKNEYRKSISGFEVFIGEMRVQTELILGGDEQQFISPSSTFQKAYAAQEGLDRYGIQILAVVFDDGTTDGDIKYIKEITDYRWGIRTERQRVLALLDQVILSKTQHISRALEELEAHMTSISPSTQQNSRLDNVGLGIRNERRRILDEIRILRDKDQYTQSEDQNARQVREALLIVKSMSENIIRLASPESKPRRSSQ